MYAELALHFILKAAQRLLRQGLRRGGGGKVQGGDDDVAGSANSLRNSSSTSYSADGLGGPLGENAVARAPLPRPMLPGNWEPAKPSCFFGERLRKSVVVETRVRKDLMPFHNKSKI